MFETCFPQVTTLTDNAQLRQAFGTESVTLDLGAALTVCGTIALGQAVVFRGTCSLGDGTRVDNGCILMDIDLGAGNRIRPFSILQNLTAGDRNLFGPFCFIRDDCTVANDAILGAHVEAARSHFGSGVKISHRAFVGDAEVADEAIIGAGVVFCNWDGRMRQSTTVGAGATIGSGTLLVPPLAIGANAVIAAGSTVTRDVPEGAKIIQRRGPSTSSGAD